MTSKLLTATFVASALLAGLGATPAMAQGNTNTPRIDQAQEAIHARIQQGLQAGRITPSEAQALYRRDRDIQNREAAYKSNGNATPQERQALRAEIGSLGTEIERLMSRPVVVQQSSTPGIDNREAKISQRIEEGIRSGRISQREARKLNQRERTIASHEAQYKSDGTVTSQERRQLRKELDALSADVDRMMRNNRRG